VSKKRKRKKVKGIRIPKTIEQKLSDLDAHLFLLRENWQGLKENASYLKTVLHNNYEEFKTNYDESYEKQYGFFRSVVDDVVHDYLKCGDLKEGFARVRCTNPDCREEYPCLPAGRSWHSHARDGGSAQAVIPKR